MTNTSVTRNVGNNPNATANMSVNPNTNTNVATFALAHTLLNTNVIDYSTESGKKIYKTATAPLSIKFNGEI